MSYEFTYTEGDINSHLNMPERKSIYFEHLTPVVEVPKNHVLYKAGDVPDHCYYIKRGIIASFEYTQNGEEHIYHMNGDGSLMFESNVITQDQITINFKTLVPSSLVKISRGDLLRAITSNPSVSFDVLCSLARKFHGANLQIRESTSRSAYWKICNLLLTLSNKYGIDYDGKVLINLKISQQMLAGILRINRTTVARGLKELRSLQLIDLVNGCYCIRNQGNLLAHMEYLELEENLSE